MTIEAPKALDQRERPAAPCTPDPVEIAMEAQASGKAPTGEALALLRRQSRLIDEQIGLVRSERFRNRIKALRDGALPIGLVLLVLIGCPAGVEAQQPGRSGGHIDTLTVTGIAGAERRLLVAVPPGFETADRSRVNVVYMLDGEGLFAAKLGDRGWQAETALWSRIDHGCAPSSLIVGVEAGETRTRDYTPSRRLFLGGGGLAAFERDLIERVLPAVAARYDVSPTSDETLIVGASYGGLAALHIGLAHPDRFGTIGALSPSLWWAPASTRSAIDAAAARGSYPRTWLSIGQDERIGLFSVILDPIANLRQLRNRMVSRGWRDGESLELRVFPGDQHDDRSWRRQLPAFWAYALGNRSGPGCGPTHLRHPAD